MARTRDLVRELKRVGDALAMSPGVSQEARDRWVLASTEIMRDAVRPKSGPLVESLENRAAWCIEIAQAEGLRNQEETESRAVVLMNYSDSQLRAIETAAHAGLQVTRDSSAGTL